MCMSSAGSHTRPEPGSPADWLRYARSDLALARTSPQDGVLLETLCFHAQQAVEKALKAALLHLTSETPPYSHNLGLLLDLLRPIIEVPPPIEGAAELTDYAIMTRYPADVGEVDNMEWTTATNVADTVVEWVTSIIA